MCKILLDIGAGNSTFVKHLCNSNHDLDVLCLVGESNYKKLWKDKVYWWQRIKKIQASYHDFGIKGNSLDFVTLNAPYLLVSLSGLVEESARCLKKGGYFISAHPIGLHPKMNTDFFEDVYKEKGPLYFEKPSRFFGRREIVLNLDGYGQINYPASPVIRHRLEILESRIRFEDLKFSTSYIYAGMRNRPTVKVWKRL